MTPSTFARILKLIGMDSNAYSLNNLLLPLALFSLILIHSCAKQAESAAREEATATASGPFFTGPNSLIAEQRVNLTDLIEGVPLNAEKLQSVSLEKVQVNLRAIDSLDFSYFNNASLSIVSSDLEMISIATLNPIETDGQSISLTASQEADLSDYFKAESYSLVLDLGLNEDLYQDELGANILLDLSITYTE